MPRTLTYSTSFTCLQNNDKPKWNTRGADQLDASGLVNRSTMVSLQSVEVRNPRMIAKDSKVPWLMRVWDLVFRKRINFVGRHRPRPSTANKEIRPTVKPAVLDRPSWATADRQSNAVWR